MRQGETIQHRGMYPPDEHTRQAQLPSTNQTHARHNGVPAGTSVPAGIGAWASITDPIAQNFTGFHQASDGVRVLTRHEDHTAAGRNHHLVHPGMQTPACRPGWVDIVATAP